MPIDDAAIDRIIHAVEHWADDIEDPVDRVLHYAFDDLVNQVIEAYCKRQGLEYPGGSGGGWAHIRFKFDNGEKLFIRTEWF